MITDSESYKQVLIYKCSKCGKIVKKTKEEMRIEENLKLTHEERIHNLIDLIETLMKANAGMFKLCI